MNSRIFFISICTLVTVLTAGEAPAQNALSEDCPDGSEDVCLRAESAYQRVLDGRTVTDLTRVLLKQGRTSLRADRGVDEGNGYVTFRGKVRIVEEADTIYADFVRYNKETRVGRASGSVRLTDGLIDVLAASAVHFSEEDRTTFEEGLRYADSTSTLKAGRGVYFTEENRMEFSVDVELVQDSTIVQADSVSYLREKEVSRAYGRVSVRKQGATGSTTLLADRLVRFSSMDSTIAAGNVMMLSADQTQTSTDSLLVVARKVTLIGGEADRMTAVDSIQVVSGEFASRGDSLVYRRSSGTSESRLYGTPLAWQGRTQVRADTLRTLGLESRIDTVIGTGNVFVASRDTSINRIHQLTGRGMTAIMRRDTLQSILVKPNAQGLFYMGDDEAGAQSAENDLPQSGAAGSATEGREKAPRSAGSRKVSALRASGDSLRITFSAGEFDKVAWYAGIEGTYYSSNLLDRVSNLSGYIWSPDERPNAQKLKAVFRRELQARTVERNSVPSSQAHGNR